MSSVIVFLITNVLWISRHVIHDENIFPFFSISRSHFSPVDPMFFPSSVPHTTLPHTWMHVPNTSSSLRGGLTKLQGGNNVSTDAISNNVVYDHIDNATNANVVSDNVGNVSIVNVSSDHASNGSDYVVSDHTDYTANVVSDNVISDHTTHTDIGDSNGDRECSNADHGHVVGTD